LLNERAMQVLRLVCSGLSVVVVSSFLGCSQLVPIATQRSAAGAPESSEAPRPRTNFVNEHAEKNSDEMLDRQEKAALKVLNRTLARDGSAPESSSTVALALRHSPVHVRLEPIADEEVRGVVGDNFLQLKDSYTDRVQQLQRKMVEQGLSKAERKEILRGAKYMMKVSDLRMTVVELSSQVQRSSFGLQTMHLQTMAWTSLLIDRRRLEKRPIDADDYAWVKRHLERARRAEAISASMMGLLAAFQAVLNDGGDPKALDAVAEASLKAFPVKASVSDDEARKYVDDFADNLGVQKAKYEQMMRKAYGDARYEKSCKAEIDAMFRQVEDAQTPPAAPPSRLSPTQLSKVNQGLGVANAVKNGDASGALDGAAKMLPADSTIGSSLAGVSALSKGDPKGAIDAAMKLVPGGPVKEGLSFAASLLFGTDKRG
jgi:hypothetical protein